MRTKHSLYFYQRCRQRSLCLVHNLRVTQIDAIVATSTSDQDLLRYVQAISHHHAQGLAQAPSRATAEQALAALYDRCVHRVHALVRRFVHDDGVAQEVTEDVFYQAWTQAPRFDAERSSVMGWLLTMARSRALDAWRKHKAQIVQFDGDVADDALAHMPDARSPLDILAAVDAQHHIHQALQQLAPTARQMLSLAFFQGLTHAEISVHLELPLGTVKTTVRRALISLREGLQAFAPNTELVALQAEDTRS
jgi:RNA polymerase sigma factor (sigma-70 family)